MLVAALAATAWTGAARAEWSEASSSHFVIYSELPADKLKSFAERLERFDAMMRDLLGKKPEPVGKANRVTVYMVDDIGDVDRLTSASNAAGFYRPRAGATIAVVPRNAGRMPNSLSAEAILFHEYAHHLMFSVSPNAVFPAWYVEGWAEALATAQFHDDGGLDLGRPPQYRGTGLLEGNALPIDKLLVADTLKLDARQRDGLYGRGWLLTHYLIFSGERRGQLSAYLQAINAGKSSMEAAGAFGDLRALDRELERYKLGRFRVVKVGTEKMVIGPVDIRKLGPGEAATMGVRIRSKAGVNDKTAPAVYERAKRAAAPFPTDPAAQLVLAEAAFDAGDYPAAEAAADRAMQADPKTIDSYVYKAMARMAVAEKAGDKKPDTWRVIRNIIAGGNRIDPDDPQPLILYFRAFQAAGIAPNQNAKLGLRRAFELCPQDKGLRFNLAMLYLRERDKASARALLAPLAFQPHGRGIALVAAKTIELIDGDKIDDALRALDAEKDDKGEGPGGAS